jgi:hypothetical protein
VLYAKTGSDVKVRSSTFGTGASIIGDCASAPATKLDLGRPGDPGGTMVWAVGNTWVPNESGADAAGHFTSGTYGDWIMGKNVLKRATSSIQF